MGPDGRLYFPQVFANEIWVYDLDAGRGQLLFDDLSVPTAVKFDSRGRLVMSESGAGRITAIDLADRRARDARRGAEGHRQRVGRRRRPHLRVALRRRARRRGDRQPPPHPVRARPARPPRSGHRPRRPAAARRRAQRGRGDADGEIERLLTLLIELHTLAIGVAPFGDDLAVLAITGEILLYRSGSTEPSVLVEGLVAPTAIAADGPTACWWWSAAPARSPASTATAVTDAVVHGLAARRRSPVTTPARCS